MLEVFKEVRRRYWVFEIDVIGGYDFVGVRSQSLVFFKSNNYF